MVLSADLISSDTPGDTEILVEADADFGAGDNPDFGHYSSDGSARERGESWVSGRRSYAEALICVRRDCALTSGLFGS